ncbi:hypothetical protein [Caballeronia sp. dw_19]|nr:hypothetical protein [Caballeronia sp. dw_19]
MQLQITMTVLMVVSTLLTIATFSHMAVARMIIQKVAVRGRAP